MAGYHLQQYVIIWMHNAEANQDMKLTGKSYHNYYAAIPLNIATYS